MHLPACQLPAGGVHLRRQGRGSQRHRERSILQMRSGPAHEQHSARAHPAHLSERRRFNHVIVLVSTCGGSAWIEFVKVRPQARIALLQETELMLLHATYLRPGWTRSPCSASKSTRGVSAKYAINPTGSQARDRIRTTLLTGASASTNFGGKGSALDVTAYRDTCGPECAIALAAQCI